MFFWENYISFEKRFLRREDPAAGIYKLQNVASLDVAGMSCFGYDLFHMDQAGVFYVYLFFHMNVFSDLDARKNDAVFHNGSGFDGAAAAD